MKFYPMRHPFPARYGRKSEAESSAAMKRQLWISALLGVALVFGPAFAWAEASSQESAPVPIVAPAVPVEDQPTTEQLTRLFELMGTKKQIEDSFQTAAAAARQELDHDWDGVIEQSPALKAMTPEDKAKLKALMSRFVEQQVRIYRADEVVADLIPVYQRHLTREDVAAIIAFLGTPAGQHFVMQQGPIAREYVPIAMKHMREPSRANSDELVNEMKALIAAAIPSGDGQEPEQPVANGQPSAASNSQSDAGKTRGSAILDRLDKYTQAFLGFCTSGESPKQALLDALAKKSAQ